MKEYKSFKLSKMDVDEKQGMFEGYAAVFGNLDLVGDIIEKGAFKRSINSKKGKFPILHNHWFDAEIGLTTEMDEDETGLKFKGVFHISEDPKMDVQLARETYAKVMNRIKYDMPMGVSIGYNTVKSIRDTDRNARLLKEVKLFEISLVTFPANEMATVTGVKSDFFRYLERNLAMLEQIKYNALNDEQKNLLAQYSLVIDTLLTGDSQKHSPTTLVKYNQINLNPLKEVFDNFK